MIFMIVCGLVLINESRAYTTMGLLNILGCTLLCIAGIYIVTLKNNLMTNDNSEKAECSSDGFAQQHDNVLKNAAD